MKTKTHKLFLLHPENGRFLGRETQRVSWLTLGYYQMAVVAVGCLLYGSLWLGMVVSDWYSGYRLQSCIAVQAQVLSVSHGKYAGGGVTWVQYSYAVGSERHEGKGRVNRSYGKNLHVGGAVTALYDPNSPDYSQLAHEDGEVGEIPHDLPTVPLLLGGVPALAGVFGGGLFVRRWRTVRRLAREGLLLDGVIQEVSCKLVPKWGTDLKLVYSFTSPTGKLIKAKGRSGSHPAPNATQGAKVKVLYLNDKTFMAL